MPLGDRSPEQTYSIYGLRLRTGLPLPMAPAPFEGEDDVIVRPCRRIPYPRTPPPPVMTLDWRDEERHWCLRYHDRDGEVLAFWLDKQATQVDIFSTFPEATGDIAAVLLGPALAAALHLRGVPIFHAAAVVVEQRAILIAGFSGAGKSTLTAALVARGAPLLSEELSALAFLSSDVLVQPGYPRLRLCPDALPAVAQTMDLPRVFSARVPDDKRWLDATTLRGGFCSTTTPIQAIYVLSPRSNTLQAPVITSLPFHRAALALLDHLYGTRWLRIPREQALDWCAYVAGRAPVRLVQAAEGLERVTETAEAILADARCTIPPLPRGGRGEGRVEAGKALAGPMLPHADVKTAIAKSSTLTKLSWLHYDDKIPCRSPSSSERP